MGSLNIYQVIKAPVASEKANRVGEKHNQYVFLVDPAATKDQVKKAVEAIFSVQATGVNVTNKKSITKRTMRGVKARVAGHRKAYVSLAAGQEIDLYSGI